MNSFEQIKALLELKEKGTISDAEFKQMLAILEAESKKEDHSESQSANIEVSDDTEEWGVRQKEAEKKLKTKAQQTTREILERHKSGKIEEAFNLFTRFERKNLFDPKIQQLLNKEKAEIEERNKRKTEANLDQELIQQLDAAHRNKDFARAKIIFDQINNKTVISPLIKYELTEFEKKKAEEARFDREKKGGFNKQEQLKKLRQKRQVYSFVIGLALILAFTGYCSNKKTPSNDNESLGTKETTYIENADTLAKSEDDAALKQKFLSHQYITTIDARLRKAFGIVFLQYTEQGEYRRASTVLGLDKPDALIKDPKLIQLLNERFGLNLEVQQQPKLLPKPKPEFKPETQLKPEPKQQEQRQEQNTSAELPEFPDKYVKEAESCKKTILDPNNSAAEKKVAADRIIEIKREFVSNQNKKWKANAVVQSKLNKYETAALTIN